MTSSLDQAQVLNAAMDRKAKQFDKVIGEWKGKVIEKNCFIFISYSEDLKRDSAVTKIMI